MAVSRRKFLTLTGAAAGLTLLPAEFAELLQAVADSEHEWPGPGIETWVNSICQLCPGGCGIRVRLLDGWPVTIRGNPDHPVNHGALCPKGAAGLQAFYDPDRIRGPLRRAGRRGEGKWQPTTWDEALRAVTERLRALRDAGRPEGLVVVAGQDRDLTPTLWKRFLAAFGSPNYVSTAIGCETSDTVLALTQGLPGHVAYDLESTNYVLSFGMNLLEGSWSPVWQMRSYAHLRQGRPGGRAKIVQADVRFSATAAKADEWLPIRPGTDVALALAVAHVLVRDGLYDKTFVGQHAFGFEDWIDAGGHRREGFRTLVLRDYAPEKTVAITGIEPSRIVRIAREFGQTRPAIAVGDRGVSRYSNGLVTRWAIHCLNALVGSLEVPGGILVPPPVPLAPLPALPADSVAARGRARPRIDGGNSVAEPLATSAIYRLSAALRSGRPYPAEAVFLYFANPAFSLPATLRMQEALDRVPLIVSFSPFHDESTQAADFVLPDHTFLERWGADPTPRNIGFPVLGVRQPVRPALYDTRATSDVILALAEALGRPVQAALPWKDTQAVVRASIEGVYRARRGRLVTAVAPPWYESHRASPTPAPAKSFDEFWMGLLERGGWWDPGYQFRDWRRALRTPSGKFEFFSERLSALLRFEPVKTVGQPGEFPLLLNVFRPLPFTGGQMANLPYLDEIAGKLLGASWETWVEVNPATARRFGIAEGDAVWVESAAGRVRARARIHRGAPPDIVSVPHGLGHRTGGRWAAGLGANPNDVLGATETVPVGTAAYPLMRVRLARI